MAWLREIGVGVCGYHREAALSSSIESMEHAESNEEWIEDDHEEQSSRKFEEQRDS